MKKLILLLAVILTLASCERQSGRRPAPEKKLYIVEYVDDSTDNIIEVRFADSYSAIKYRSGLDSLNLWSRLYSEPINQIKK